MNALVPHTGARLVVAIQFDGLAEHLVRNAARLCRKTGMGLHLVHVVPVSPFVQFNNLGGDLTEFTRLLPPSERVLREAAHRLEGFFSLAEGVPVTTKVLSQVESVSSALIQEAEEVGGVAILCGSGTETSPVTFKGLSTVIALLTHATLPILSLNIASQWAFDGRSFRILLADDLREDTRDAHVLGMQWAEVLRATVRHVHVNEVSSEILDEALANAVSERRWTSLPEEDTADLHDVLRRKLQNRLEDRVAPQAGKLRTKGGHYENAILEGLPLEELAREVASFQPDLIVFGRHRTLHRRPFELGTLHFKSMLTLRCAIMVAP